MQQRAGSRTPESALDAIRKQRAVSAAAAEAVQQQQADSDAESARLSNLSSQLEAREVELSQREARLDTAMRHLEVKTSPWLHGKSQLSLTPQHWQIVRSHG